MTHLVGNLLLGELALGRPDTADLRAGINPGGEILDQPTVRVAADDMTGRKTPLVVARAGEPRETDHIADRIDMLDLSLVELVDVDLLARVGFATNLVQAQIVGISGATLRPEQIIAAQLLARFQVQNHTIVAGLYLLIDLIMANNRASVAQMITQRVDDFV